jgi:broad specificity phosphatase PhoE
VGRKVVIGACLYFIRHRETASSLSGRHSVIARVRKLERNVAIFSDGQFGRVLAARWIGLPVGRPQRFVRSTASVNILGYDRNLADQSAIVQWNAAANEFSTEGVASIDAGKQH